MAMQLDVGVHRPIQLRDVAWRRISGIAVLFQRIYRCERPRRERARDLASAARQAPEPAKRTGGVNSFSGELTPCSPTTSFCAPSSA